MIVKQKQIKTDQEAIKRVNALKPEALRRILRGGAGIEYDPPWIGNYKPELPAALRKSFYSIRVTDPLVIEAAWGPRIVTSRTRGMHLTAYPAEVQATLRVWIDWLAMKKSHVSVVIAKKPAKKRVKSALKTAQKIAQPPVIPKEETQRLLQKREELRAQRRFVEADEIRALLTQHGNTVADKKV